MLQSLRSLKTVNQEQNLTVLNVLEGFGLQYKNKNY